MQEIKVENMRSVRGNVIPNQFIISTSMGEYFQSYETIIAFRDNYGKITLDRDSWDYSTTIGKYRNMFLDEERKKTEVKIKDGIYKLANLNK